ncbi:S8 family serine peptidase [Hyphomicrobiales bacterium]|nr:S8 family serine peptidase [Hyphomicrobiales bacterium]
MKTNKLAIIVFLTLFLAGCGGGGGSPKLPYNTPLKENNNVIKEVQINFYTPKEVFETPEYMSQWGLESINASTAYSLGATGDGIVVGVIDEALDWGHHEFLKEGILHPDSVLTYSGNREPTPLEKFHGTATSSIIAGRKDDSDISKNMHGIAFDSEILFVAIELGSPPSDGEYEPLAISEFSWEAYDEREAQFYKEISSKADIVNNSFGFTGQVTDYSKEELENTFPKFIKTLGDEEETIFVWSAGNFNGILGVDGIAVEASNPGILAGLGYYFPELDANNVAVVAIDSNGKIADFSNRCGVTKGFCIAAPGVRVPLAIPNNLFSSLSEREKAGFSQGVLDYLEENPNEAYLSGSGTSFAAPHVTGSLAVLFELFKGNLSSKQILKRLYDSANKSGEYSNQDIYGQGVLDLGAASSPIGLPLFYTDASVFNTGVSTNSSFISSGKSFGDSFSLALNDKDITFFDALGAPFSIKAGNFMNTKIPLSRNSKKLLSFNEKKYTYFENGFLSQSSWQSVLSSDGVFGYRLNNASMNYFAGNENYFLSYGVNPSKNLLDEKPLKLIKKAFNDDNAFLIPWTKASEEGFNAGFSKQFKSKVFKVNFFSGSRRVEDWFLKPTFLLQHEGKTNGISFNIGSNRNFNIQRNFMVGFMNHHDEFFDNSFEGAFDSKGGKSFYSAFNLQANLKNGWKLIGTLSMAKVKSISSNKFIRNISGVIESNFDIGIFKENFLIKRDIISFRLKQDPRVEKANITFNLPVGRTPGGEIRYSEMITSIIPSGRELLFESLWSYENDYTKNSIALTLIKDEGHIGRKNIDASILFATKKFF